MTHQRRWRRHNKIIYDNSVFCAVSLSYMMVQQPKCVCLWIKLDGWATTMANFDFDDSEIARNDQMCGPK